MPPPPRRPFQPSKGRKPGPPAPKPSTRKGTAESAPSNRESGWDPVAAWYDKLVGESGSDYHRQVILPATLRMLAPRAGERIIDVCCGQGVLAHHLLESGISAFTGVDASPRLIAAAKKHHGGDPRANFQIADVCVPGSWADGSYDAATCLMAVHDVADVSSMFANMAQALKPGGRAVLVFMHPCFRIPRSTHWGWDNDQKIQYRRVDAYLTPQQIPITTHPGKNSGEQTIFHHRPLSPLITALGNTGLAVTACEELCSHRRSQGSGPFSKAEHRAAGEIPVFIALKVGRLS